MSITVVHGAVDSMVHQTRLEVVAMVKLFLKQETEISSSDLDTLMEKFQNEKIPEASTKASKVKKETKKKKLADVDGGEIVVKEKKPQSAYNKFIGIAMRANKYPMMKAIECWNAWKAQNNDTKDSNVLVTRYEEFLAQKGEKEVVKEGSDEEEEAEAEL